jgi:hypothetical protein
MIALALNDDEHSARPFTWRRQRFNGLPSIRHRIGLSYAALRGLCSSKYSRGPRFGCQPASPAF